MDRGKGDRTDQARVAEINGVGPVVLERSSRAKYLRITINPDGFVRVAVPFSVSFGHAEQFARHKQAWISKHLAKIQQATAHRNQLRQQAATIDLITAPAILGKRLAELAARHNFSVSRVTIRNQKTRWGSCSARNAISLNIHLALLPPVLLDYVLLHELVHTRIKNHGPLFWQALEEIMPAARRKRAMLRRYPLQVIEINTEALTRKEPAGSKEPKGPSLTNM